jgi:hypothetical protein
MTVSRPQTGAQAGVRGLQFGENKAPPVRRSYIPKADRNTRRHSNLCGQGSAAGAGMLLEAIYGSTSRTSCPIRLASGRAGRRTTPRDLHTALITQGALGEFVGSDCRSGGRSKTTCSVLPRCLHPRRNGRGQDRHRVTV